MRKCICGKLFNESETAFWDESGSSAIKFCECPECNKRFAIFPHRYDEDNRNCLFKEKADGTYGYEEYSAMDMFYCAHDFTLDEIEYLVNVKY